MAEEARSGPARTRLERTRRTITHVQVRCQECEFSTTSPLEARVHCMDQGHTLRGTWYYMIERVK